MNLYEDFANAVRRELIAQGCDVAHVKDDDDTVVRLYRKIGRYTIESRPRQVLKAVSLECPSQYILGMQQLEQAIEAGESLSPYRSTRVTSPTWRDVLLDHWGIHHFHLGSNTISV